MGAFWKCSKCGNITETKKTSPTDGYCELCKEYHLLHRYDPLNNLKQEIITEIRNCQECNSANIWFNWKLGTWYCYNCGKEDIKKEEDKFA